ncbi:hypothetical protein quinque_005740 [Culex quinquefasciatus]|uniref:Uncharacterized protein n=1 Tax=Culex pipiens pipiens TaxID=38569 RepID=A0ABD1DLH2_CULPP
MSWSRMAPGRKDVEVVKLEEEVDDGLERLVRQELLQPKKNRNAGFQKEPASPSEAQNFVPFNTPAAVPDTH